MKIFFLQSGWIRTKRHLLVKGRGVGEPYTVPIPFFLLVHPKGKLLFDTGQPLSDAFRRNVDPDADFIPLMTEHDYVIPQLAKLGIAPSSISHVAVSHLHGDHAGGLGEFKNAVHLLRRAELESSRRREAFEKLASKLLDSEELYDVFGDGSARLMSTPGHTPGHQSLLLASKDLGPTLLCADAVYADEVLEDYALSSANSSRADAVRTLMKIRAMKRDGVRIVSGHDPVAWRSFRLAPHCYE
jgi:glyoxylase-like metal-dependent hydrolase (beta-lactamase superfamily II)